MAGISLALPNSATVDRNRYLEREWRTLFSNLTLTVGAMTASGTTANRPTDFLWIGRMYFDTTLGQPVWYDGTGWVDATGTTA